MNKVRAKKHLGQHFLLDKKIASDIAAILNSDSYDKVLEIGPGMGVLTEFLYPVWKEKLYVIEIDKESVQYLKKVEWAENLNILEGDFLNWKPAEIFDKKKIALIGNYPYNISTEIAFKAIENVENVAFFGGMFQLEVGKRLCAPHGNKAYGVTSVLLQAYFNCTFNFIVEPNAFSPPPKVKSGVISCVRKNENQEFVYKYLKLVVKTAFNQRRKTLSNALKSLTSSNPRFILPENWAGLRAEQLSVEDFIQLSRNWQQAL
ncbi:MAG: ribosomal RNA small subunit methyltransferase A [Bacteroidetes bacterium]|nr:ribosomal RNA small subunit methyltransferase A [Bacteroidota bacterium]